MALNDEAVWQALERVMDPEIPTLSVVDLGMIQELRVDGVTAYVAITPTFLGCPALDMIQDAIRDQIGQAGAQVVTVELRLEPVWTSNRITPDGQRKLKAFGLAPPLPHTGEFNIRLLDNVPCPWCDSTDTHLESMFGATLCRAIYYCQACRQSFEQFKPV